MRVFAYGGSGRQITLYEIVPGEVAFGSLERRMEDYLVERAEDGRVPLTHQAIANDLGSSREVVNRLLKDFERRGRVRLGRAELVILDPAGD